MSERKVFFISAAFFTLLAAVNYTYAGSSEPNQTKSSLEKTQETFNLAFNTPGKEGIILRGLIKKANEEEKTWIKEALINRFNSESDPRIRWVYLSVMVWFRE